MKKTKLKLPTKSNATLKQTQTGKMELNFPRQGGFLHMGKHRFKDQDDFMSLLVAGLSFGEA